MKKLMLWLAFTCFSASTLLAQVTAPAPAATPAQTKISREIKTTPRPDIDAKKAEVVKRENAHKKANVGTPVKSDGTPDRRYKRNKNLKKDGTPDRRFKDHKPMPDKGPQIK